MAEDFDLELKQIFLEEASQILEEAERVYLTLGENPEKSATETLFRLAHNLKGSSKAVGFQNIASLTHSLETFLLKIKEGTISCNTEIVGVLLKSNDRLISMVREAKQSGADNGQFDDLIQDFQNFTDISEAGKHKEQDHEVAISQESQEITSQVWGVFSEEKEVVKSKETAEAADVVSAANESQANQKNSQKQLNSDESIRVALNRIDKLQNYIGELVVLETVLKEQVKLGNSILLRNSLRQLEKVTKEIQDTSMSLRMVPIKPTFQKLNRVVRDTSLMLGKDINLILKGEDTEVDKIVLEKISDPLVHMIRNAVDHGIEMPDEREAKGKQRQGNIVLEARHESGNLVIDIIDDGKGLDDQVLMLKAIDKKIIPANSKLTKDQCLNLIFAPGFSTKTEVTEVSGRGVGMDVVKTNIESIRGSVRIESTVDKGTKFSVRIPLTLAIIDGMIVQVGLEKWVLPLHHVRESMRFEGANIQHVVGMGNVLVLRGENIPVLDLGLALGMAQKSSFKDKVVIVIQDKETTRALVVDMIVAIHPVVTKALGAEFRVEPGIIGSAILGDGKAALILEISSLIKSKKVTQNSQQLRITA